MNWTIEPLTVILLFYQHLISHLLTSYGANTGGNWKHSNTKLALMPVLAILVICNNYNFECHLKTNLTTLPDPMDSRPHTVPQCYMTLLSTLFMLTMRWHRLLIFIAHLFQVVPKPNSLFIMTNFTTLATNE